MARHLTVVQPLPPGDHAPAFREDPSSWLPGARHAGPGRWHVTLHAGGIDRMVLCSVGDPWTTREGIQRRITWTPMAEDADVVPVEKWLPELHGELYLVGTSATPSLALVGDVEVPFGRLGEAVDALVLGRVAQRTAATFLREVAAHLAEGGDEAQPAESGAHQRS